MKEFTYIKLLIEKNLGRIVFNREEVRNAFNIEMIREISTAFKTLENNAGIRLIIISAEGGHFSAGADLNWMKKGLEQDRETLLSESYELATLFQILHSSSKVVIVSIRGSVFGGANGLVAAADIAIASKTSLFAFSEAKLGLIPATIAPYIIYRVGKSTAAEWMITARSFKAEEAFHKGLIHHLVEDELLEVSTEKLVQSVLNNGPLATKGIKELISKTDLSEGMEKLMESNSKLLAQYRTSEEGQEGIAAFLEKRDAAWKNE